MRTYTSAFVKLVMVAKYFELRVLGGTQQYSSNAAARTLPPAFQLGPRTVVNWAKTLQISGRVPSSLRGKHQKTPSLIHDEDYLNMCGKWLRTSRPPMRTPRSFRLFLNESVLPELTGALLTNVSESTARRWMIHVGYKFGSWKKDVYMDGYERADVVEYRKGFCTTWLELSERMVSYKDPDMDIVEARSNPLGDAVVWVTHDESVFYANDDGGKVWTNAAHPDLPKKGRGRSIM
ncbi:hypothetical protein As57867_020004, partial [Aphanomyces stellatus]